MDLFDWDKTLADFKAKAKEFLNSFTALQQMKIDDPVLNSERQRLINTGSIIKSTIETTTGLIDQAQSALKKAGDFFGFDGLGIIPVAVPIAVVAASVTAIAYWLTDFDRLRNQVYSDMIEKGATVEEATKAINAMKSNTLSIGGGLFSPFALAAGAGIFWWLYRGN